MIKWNEVFDMQQNVSAFIDFGLQKIGWKELEDRLFDDSDRHQMRRLRNKGTVSARKAVRKALKRRGLLNKFNLVTA